MPTVELLSYTPEPEKLIAAAARLCYSDSHVTELMNNLNAEKTQAFIQKLADLGHYSPMEHVSFTFAIEGVSRAFLAQVTRHRIASFSVQSQRYVSKADFPYITPPEIAADPTALTAFEQAMQRAGEAYETIAQILIEKHTENLMAQGKSEKDAKSAAQKMAIEDARFVLPNACDTKMVVTMNVRSLYNFFRLRCCNRAQWEIHAVADKMLREVQKVAPQVFAGAGPGCVSGPCPEGNMTCGKIKEVREKYTKLEQNNYYAEKLNASKLFSVYETHLERVKQYLAAEIEYVRRSLTGREEVLELGAGYGRILKELAPLAKSLTGIDISPDTVALGKAYLKEQRNVQIQEMDVHHMTFAPQSFDCILCLQNGFSAFKAEAQPLVSRVMELLRPGGRAFFSSYSTAFWQDRLAWFEEQAQKGLLGEIDYDLTKDGKIVCKDGFTATTFSPEELTALGKASGHPFLVEEVDGSSVFLVISKQETR